MRFPHHRESRLFRTGNRVARAASDNFGIPSCNHRNPEPPSGARTRTCRPPSKPKVSRLSAGGSGSLSSCPGVRAPGPFRSLSHASARSAGSVPESEQRGQISTFCILEALHRGPRIKPAARRRLGVGEFHSKLSTVRRVCSRIVAAMALSSSALSLVAHGSGVGRAMV